LASTVLLGSADVGAKPTIDAMTAPHPRRTAATLGIAAAGLTLGHGLAYAIAPPGTHAREEMLHATGHGYMGFATQVALLAGTLGLASLFLARLRRHEGRGSFLGDACSLAVVQSGAFLLMEVGERVLSGASLHDLEHGPLLGIGLGVQIVVALVGACLLRLTDRAAEAAGELGSSSHPPLPELLAAVHLGAAVAPRPPTVRDAASRAPPSLL
jgi:hypothetical protein